MPLDNTLPHYPSPPPIPMKQKKYTMNHEWKQYKRKGLSEMRPYVKGEDLSKISVTGEDNPETDLGMIARNPKNHADQWYVSRKYFEDNLEEVMPLVKETMNNNY